MNKKECEIIKDLLPSYIEGLTSNVTNEYISSHIDSCNECAKIYEDMKKDFYNQEGKEEQSINFLKKHKKKLNILRFLVVILLLISLGISIYAAKLFRSNFEGTQKMLYNTIHDLEEAGYQLVTTVQEDGTVKKQVIPINK